MIPEGGAFAFFFGSNPGHLTDFFIPSPGNFAIFLKKMLMPGGWPGGGGGWALLELTDALQSNFIFGL